MKRWQLSVNVRLWLALSLLGCLSLLATQPGYAEELPSKDAQMLVQSPAPQATPAKTIVPITSVKVNPSDKGVEVVLETVKGEQLQVTNRSTDSNFIADISNAQLSNGYLLHQY